MQLLTPVFAPGTLPSPVSLPPTQAEALYGQASERLSVSASPALIEPLHETTRGLEEAVIAYTKGLLSDCELWAELDWAASCYRRAAKTATKAEQHVRSGGGKGLDERQREQLAKKHAQDATRYTAWAEGAKLRYAELTRD